MISIINITPIDNTSDAAIAAAINAAVAKLPGANLPHNSSIALPMRVKVESMAFEQLAVVSLLSDDIVTNEELETCYATLLIGQMDYARSSTPGPLTTAAINAQEGRVNGTL
jgi:hypothetical protein